MDLLIILKLSFTNYSPSFSIQSPFPQYFLLSACCVQNKSFIRFCRAPENSIWMTNYVVQKSCILFSDCILLSFYISLFSGMKFFEKIAILDAITIFRGFSIIKIILIFVKMIHTISFEKSKRIFDS